MKVTLDTCHLVDTLHPKQPTVIISQDISMEQDMIMCCAEGQDDERGEGVPGTQTS